MSRFKGGVDYSKIPQCISAVEQAKRQVVYEALIVIQGTAKERTPVKSGALRDSIVIKMHGMGDAGLVGPTVHYGPHVEFGTRPHVIRVKHAKVLADKKTGRVFGRQVNHPGTKAQPYLRPAVDENIGAIQNRAETLIMDAIRRALM